MRSFTQLNMDDFLVYLTTKQFGTASSIEMHWNEVKNGKQLKPGSLRTAAESKMKWGTRIPRHMRQSSDHCKVLWILF